MAWRLGTWHHESLFERIEQLLALGSRLPNWSNEAGLLANPEFGQFWSLIWQLQVAEYLVTAADEVSWTTGGPDLVAVVEGDRLFVECYTHQKSHAVELFLEELLRTLGPDLRVQHDFFLKFSLPHGAEVAEFLSRAVARVADPLELSRLRAEASVSYPVVVCRPASTLTIYLEGPGQAEYDPSLMPPAAGDPGSYLRMALREAVSNKADSNELVVNRPNLLAVNYLVNTDAQLALSLCASDIHASGRDADIDALSVSVLGIEGILSRAALRLVDCPAEHPARRIAAAGP